MSLAKYHAKRKFDRTPEPSGTEKRSREQDLHFVVQKHDASHLHYDFRLELEGVLKSWAIPKGPSMNPADKRLAMMVEDHPFEYRTFEGTIPEGNYGAGEVIVWDEGTYTVDPENSKAVNSKLIYNGLQKGKITFFLEGRKLKGEFSLVKMRERGENAWLLIKHNDEYALKDDITQAEESVRSGRILSRDAEAPQKKVASPAKQAKIASRPSADTSFPHPVEPMLATLVQDPFSRKGWVFEVKWDGYRAIAEIQDGDVQLYSRNNKSFLHKFPTLVEELKQIPHNAVLDGEIVALNPEGVSDFQLLQDYENQQSHLYYYVFDLLCTDGEDIRRKPLTERKKTLKAMLPKLSRIRYSDHVETDGVKFYYQALEGNLEGIMAKDAQSPYLVGKRTDYWLKIKTHQQQEAIIAGYTEPKGSRKDIGALILAVYEENQLKYIGHTGTGMDIAMLADLKAKLDKLAVQKCPFKEPPKTNSPVHWVKPQLICEVRFQEWTQDGLMRQPVFMGLREDKPTREVSHEREQPTGQILKAENAMSSSPKADSLVIDGHAVAITHPDKLYWPDEGITKGDLVHYYLDIANTLLPYLKDRPFVMHRMPNGIRGKGFYQKDIESDLPDWVETVPIFSESNRRELNMVVCQNAETLAYLVNLGCIEMHPWSSRIGNLENPDYLIIDLDPEDIPFEKVIETAQAVKSVLDEAGAEGYCKTSGATGLHVYVPLGGRYSTEASRDFAHLVAQMTHHRCPGWTSLERSPSKRQKKVYIDYLQNNTGQTVASAYSVRPKPSATVSTPLLWKEVKAGLSPQDFTLQNLSKRLRQKGDLWKDVLGPGIDLQQCLTRLQAKS